MTDRARQKRLERNAEQVGKVLVVVSWEEAKSVERRESVRYQELRG